MAALADDWNARNKPADAQTCIDVLCGYLRTPRQPPEGQVDEDKAKALHQAETTVRQTIITTFRTHLSSGTEAEPSTGPWSHHDFDLSHAVFDFDFNLGLSRFTGTEVSFARAEFVSDRVSFAQAEFAGDYVSFSGSTFTGDRVSFYRAEFTANHVSFTRAEFAASHVSFMGTVSVKPQPWTRARFHTKPDNSEWSEVSLWPAEDRGGPRVQIEIDRF